jgi:hypothetical protein
MFIDPSRSFRFLFEINYPVLTFSYPRERMHCHPSDMHSRNTYISILYKGVEGGYPSKQ